MTAPPSAMSRLRPERVQPRRPFPTGVNDRPPRLGSGAVRATVLKRDFQPPLRDQRAKALRPLDQRDPVAKRILDAELPALLRVTQPVAVEMPDRQIREL